MRIQFGSIGKILEEERKAKYRYVLKDGEVADRGAETPLVASRSKLIETGQKSAKIPVLAK